MNLAFRREWVAAVLVLLGGVAPTPARGESPRIHVAGDASACPSPEVVAALLRSVFPERRVVVGLDGLADGSVLVRVWGERQRYGMEVGSTQRVLVDPARSCAGRARALAAVISMALAPPTVEGPPAPLKPVSPLAPVASAPPPPERWHFDLEAAFALGLAAPGAQGDAVATGFRLRAAFGPDGLALFLGVGLFEVTHQDLGLAQVRVGRIPLELGLRPYWRFGDWTLGAETGVMATVVALEGMGLGASAPSTRVELAVLLGARLEYWASARFAPFIAVQVMIVPAPFELAVEPAGVVGTLPRVRAGLFLGIVARFR